ncbi:alpha-ribazole phosphatase [Tamlana agarivorans]|uniref:Alpha-ribazole phosphatase n=1 Tax=Pseudotamlana agarivorans TaxID=481183 RepID=A0ACC5U6V1_9FLAO|nr:alpha-ribazole phosphatase [Tamlana agarivorans]MBU2950047.1 alpha-ribazole phosphatase [Tamlana agarivorans]
MEIYLIRHTTPAVEKGICYGQTDLDLVENHEEEFAAILSKLPKEKEFRVISSPLKRCTSLAETFSETATLEPRLKELNFGDWEMQAWNDIPEEAMAPWMTDFVNVAVPNGESYVQLASRVQAYFEDLAHSNNPKDHIIVCHAGPMRAFLAHVLDIPLKDSFKIKIQYGDVFHLKLENGKFQLITPVKL